MMTSLLHSHNIFGAAEREASVRQKTPGSLARYERAQGSLAGGVSSGLRRDSRPYPLYFKSGAGSQIEDVDGNQYRDFTLAWGPLILGHAPACIVKALAEQAGRGFTFGAQHDLEIEVAERLRKTIPCAELVSFANSGTEIVQVALRLARAATGRAKFIKFEGHYHGWADSVLVSYHPALSQGDESEGMMAMPVGAGQLASNSAVIAEWNNRSSVERAFEKHPGEISALICEPILCNSGCIYPDEGFLRFLREITSRYGALLIFDEVITGFRVRLGGAQELFGVTPDLATYAKAVGAGTPLSVLAGKREFMDLIATGRVVHAGTLNGNPLCLAAANAALEELQAGSPGIYSRLEALGERLRLGLERILRERDLPAVTNGRGAVFQVSFCGQRPRTYRDTLAADRRLYSDFALALLDEGILALPDGRWYLSTAHTEADVDATLEAAKRI
jgi:glutamate-1-semialdehyde 2,1-aminomutase